MGQAVSQDQNGTPAEPRRYAAAVRARLRVARAAGRMRAGGIQVTWLVVVLAGAAVPLSQALEAPSWVGPVLGFTVVIAAGIERIFQRTTDAALALDALRRALERAERQLVAPGPTAEGDRAAAFVERCEEAFRDYDERMEDYQKRMLE